MRSRRLVDFAGLVPAECQPTPSEVELVRVTVPIRGLMHEVEVAIPRRASDAERNRLLMEALAGAMRRAETERRERAEHAGTLA